MRKLNLKRLTPVAALAAVATFGVASTASAAGTRTVVCRGNEMICSARVNLGGGASNVRLVVELPGTELKLVSKAVSPEWLHGAYSLTNGRYTTGGSVYTATLNAVQSIPRRGNLTLVFAHPDEWLDCGGIRTGVGYLTITSLSERPTRAFGCPQAAKVATTWLKRFNSGQSVRRFSANGTTYRCKLLPQVPVNMQCIGDRTSVMFSGPTGR
jgi:hypothetical protein